MWMEWKLQVRQSMSIRSWPQLHVLFISVSFVAMGMIYFSSAAAELIKNNHGRNALQTPATAEPIQNYRHVPARENNASSRLSPSPSNSDQGGSSGETLRNSVTFSNLNPQLSPPLSSIIKRSYVVDDQTFHQQQTKARTKIHHRLRHEQKLNKAIQMITTNSGKNGGARICSFGDCVNNSGPSIPKKTSLLHTSQEECYHTGDVLVVVAITCLLNFSFVLVLWASVRWINYRPKRPSSWRKSKCDNKGRRFGYKRKWNSEGNCCCWDDMSRSDSSSSSEDEEYDERDDGRNDHSQDNLIVKSYSMEELRFYHG